MKQKNFTFVSGILACAVLQLSSCVKEEGWDHAPGSRILFGTATYYENESGTRTEYSGEMFTVDERRFERIEWVRSADWIRILCHAAPDGPAADYAITGEVSSSQQVSSSASVTPLSQYGLHWGTGTHYFYALYPAAGMKSNYTFKSSPGATPSERTVSASDATISVDSEDDAKAVITGYIPATQEVSFVAGTDYDEYKANMNYAYMYARNTVPGGSTGPVTLAFKPLVTAFEFTLLAEKDNSVDGDLVQVKLEASTALTGRFSAKVSDSGDPVITPTGTTGSAITVDIPDENICLSETRPLKITLLALPFQQTGLKLTLTFRKSDHTTVSRSLELKDNGSDIVVGACKKVYIRNVGVPESLYYLDPTGPTVTLNDADGTEAQILRLVSKTAGSTGTAPFDSYRVEVGTTTRVAVDEVDVYDYAEADSDGNPVLDANGQIAWQDATSSLPEGLNAVLIDGDGSVAKTASATIAAFPSSAAAETAYEDELRRERLVENTELYGEAEDLDLAFYDVENLHTPRASGNPITANCYIVDRAGTYMFPMVYGNAIDWTKAGTPGYVNGAHVFAYHDRATTANNAFRGNEMDAMHRLWTSISVSPYYRQIFTPFILDNAGLSPDAGLEAVILWEDDAPTVGSSPIISQVEYVLCSSSHIQGKYYQPADTGAPELTAGFKSSVPYIRFKILKEDIRQGNAVIALRHNGLILWSWHIWISDGFDVDGDAKGDGFQPVSGVSTSGSTVASNDLFQTNIGWCGYNTYSRRKDRVWYIRVRQSVGRAEPLVFKVIQSDKLELGNVTEHRGSNTYYQWGRKDPFLPSDGLTNNPDAGGSFSRFAGSGMNKDYHSSTTIVSSTSAVTCHVIELNSTTRPEAGHVYFTVLNPTVLYLDRFDPIGNMGLDNNSTSIPKTYPSENVAGLEINNEFGARHNWFMGAYPGNLWNMEAGLHRDASDKIIRGLDLATSKSAYDPCPPGYCVPHRKAFTAFSSSELEPAAGGDFVEAGYARTFTVGGKRVFFPLSGWRGGGIYYDNGWLGQVHSVTGEGASWTSGTKGEADYPKPTGSGHALAEWQAEINQRSYSVLFLFNRNASIYNEHSYYRSSAFPVRPVREKPYSAAVTAHETVQYEND